MIREKAIRPLSGLPSLVVLLGVLGLDAWMFVRASQAGEIGLIVVTVVVFILLMIAVGGFVLENPNEAKVLILFGRYSGTVREAGFWWVNPFNQKKRISLRTRNFETAKLKVNDANSNPIEIGAIVVWRVVDTAEAMFEVDDYENYMKVQSESAVRSLASSYPYDAHATGEPSLSSHAAEVAANLMQQVSNLLVVLCGERGTQPVVNTGTLYNT